MQNAEGKIKAPCIKLDVRICYLFYFFTFGIVVEIVLCGVFFYSDYVFVVSYSLSFNL